MKLSKLIETLQIVQKAQGTYDGEVLIKMEDGGYKIKTVAVLGDYNLIMIDEDSFLHDYEIQDFED